MSTPGDPIDGKPMFFTKAEAEAIPYEDHDAAPDFTKVDAQEPLPPPDVALKPRHKELARLHAMGKTNNQICEHLGYAVSTVSILLKTAAIQAEVERYRNKLYERDVVAALKDLGGQSVRVIEEVLHDPREKTPIRLDAAKWTIEKLTGKAKQEVNHQASTLEAFLSTLRDMQDGGETIDITPGEPRRGEPSGPDLEITGKTADSAPQARKNRFADWSDDNLD